MLNTHEIMTKAVEEVRQEELHIGHRSVHAVISVRLGSGLRKQAESICKMHGIRLSTFLKKCAEQMVTEYGTA